MRRKDKECSDPEFMQSVLREAPVMFVAMHDTPCPYCLPFNFVLLDGKIYIHSAKVGKKLQCLAANPLVAFSAAVDIRIDVQEATTWYRSVCGRGIARIIPDQAEKRLALDRLSAKYGANCKKPASDKTVSRVAIICIEIEEMTGKWARPKS